MRAWIRVLDAPSCYERAARAERKSTLQGSGLVRTKGPCAQRRVTLMPRAIATARDALSNDRRESATRFERPAAGTPMQAGYCLCMNYVPIFCEHILLIDEHACWPHYPMIVILNILVLINTRSN